MIYSDDCIANTFHTSSTHVRKPREVVSDRDIQPYIHKWQLAFSRKRARTPQVLREWFCEEMAKHGVADRYIDAFCGRTPKSILARHYSDYSPEKLKAIYDKANLKALR